MEPGSKFGSLFKRELFNGGLDLINAHRLNNIQKCLSRQRATMTTEAGDSRAEIKHQTSNIRNNHCSDVIAGILNLIQGSVDPHSVQTD